jgi:D-threonate/D-erythronate kinase
MLVVIADDFTGAAEMGGIALRFGLHAEVQTELNLGNSKPDVLIVDTNTRSGSAVHAVRAIEEIVAKLRNHSVELLFKKTDSVLRGHIREELTALLSCLPAKAVLLVPANPSRGRTIRNGHYYINGILLHESIFSDDPEAPVHTSDVLAMLGPSQSNSIYLRKNGQNLPNQGIVVGEAEITSHLTEWAKLINNDVIPAGAADFFYTILKMKGYPDRSPDSIGPPIRTNQSLFICGSSLSRATAILDGLKHKNTAVVEVPWKFLTDGVAREFCDDSLIEKTIRAFDVHRNVIIVIGGKIPEGVDVLSKIPSCLAKIAEEVMHRLYITDIYIEGGSTASAVVRQLGWKRFKPVLELAPGIVRMELYGEKEQYVTVKPGSYAWPDNMWEYPS